ncbi:MAG: gamma-glutamyltransferase [Chloroflexota bacterium]
MKKGVIAAGDAQTAAAGAEILERGGNAVDAAIAAVLASLSAESVMTNIGGGGLAIVGDIGSYEAAVYDFFVSMPSGVPSSSMDFHKIISDYGPEQVPLFIGRASAATPGLIPGLSRLVEKHGSTPLSVLLAPAIKLAREGVVLSPPQAYVLDFLTPIYADTPEITAMYAPNGLAWRAGERHSFPKLADTLTQLAAHGPSLFSDGAAAQAIAADQAANGGLITAADLHDYQVRETVPIQVRYRGLDLLLPPRPSSGGGLIAFALKLLESMDIKTYAHNQFEHIRVLAEVMRLTNVARPLWDAPATSESERVARFLSDENIARYRQKLSAILNGAQPPTEPAVPRESDHTTHISVVDSQGSFAGITTTAGESAGFVVGDTGICMNNMLGEADLHPQGFHKLPPGERLTTMMSPTVLLQDGRPRLVLGSGGSSRLRGAIFQVISNVIDFKMPLAEAVHAPRIHFEEGILQLEGGISERAAGSLRQKNYTVNCWPGLNMYFGGTHAVALESGRWAAVGDSRRGGTGLTV